MNLIVSTFYGLKTYIISTSKRPTISLHNIVRVCRFSTSFDADILKPFIFILIFLLTGNKRTVEPDCAKEDYAPEGEPLYTIVEDYADNPQKWMDSFFIVLDKMSSNGYDLLDANDFNIITGQ